MFWLIAKPSSRFLPKFTREVALMQQDYQSQTKLFWVRFRQFREQTETLPLTIITHQFLWQWSWNPETSLWLAWWKRTKCSFHPVSWRKQMKEEFNTHLTISTISLCCSLLQRKTRSSSSCPICILKKKERRGCWRRRNICVLQGKAGVYIDQKCSLYTTARKLALSFGLKNCLETHNYNIILP
jgi:hypothetical protein